MSPRQQHCPRTILRARQRGTVRTVHRGPSALRLLSEAPQTSLRPAVPSTRSPPARCASCVTPCLGGASRERGSTAPRPCPPRTHRRTPDAHTGGRRAGDGSLLAEPTRSNPPVLRGAHLLGVVRQPRDTPAVGGASREGPRGAQAPSLTRGRRTARAWSPRPSRLRGRVRGRPGAARRVPAGIEDARVHSQGGTLSGTDAGAIHACLRGRAPRGPRVPRGPVVSRETRGTRHHPGVPLELIPDTRRPPPSADGTARRWITPTGGLRRRPARHSPAPRRVTGPARQPFTAGAPRPAISAAASRYATAPADAGS